MSSMNLSDRWIGYYLQRGEECPIAADFFEAEERLSGFMYDGQPDRDYSIGEATAEAGLPPGEDEQIEAKLREMVPDAPASPIRYVSHLPPNSSLQGRRTGQTVYFLKTYQGTSFGGYQIGNQLLGIQKASHKVHYEGQLSPDGLVIEGRWWIDSDPVSATPQTEGLFHLRRAEAGAIPFAQPALRSAPPSDEMPLDVGTERSPFEEAAPPLSTKLSELTPVGWLLALATCLIFLGTLMFLIDENDALKKRFDGTFLGIKLVALIVVGVPFAVAGVFFYMCKAGLASIGLRVVKAARENEKGPE